jgi:RNA polymerase sigma-70 factor, ECF subfamily
MTQFGVGVTGQFVDGPPAPVRRQALRSTRSGAARSEPLEQEAIAAGKRGDWDGIHFLYVRYADDVLAYVQSIVHDHHAAEDIMQGVFVKLKTAIVKYEPRSVPFAAWIMRVARNAALDHLRARRQIPVEEVRAPEPVDGQMAFERRQSLIDALASLPAEQRRVLCMRHMAGLSPPEIARRLGKTESAVHGLHHRGREALKASLVELDSIPQTGRD